MKYLARSEKQHTGQMQLHHLAVELTCLGSSYLVSPSMKVWPGPGHRFLCAGTVLIGRGIVNLASYWHKFVSYKTDLRAVSFI